MAKGKIKGNEMKGGKKTANGSGMRAALYTAGLIVAALAIIALSSLLIPSCGPGMRCGGGPGLRMPEEVGLAIENSFALRFALSVFNVAIVIYLLYIHVKDYLRLKSSFTLGLIAFLFSFLMYAIATVPFMHALLGPYGRAAMISFVPMLFSAIGLLIFAKLSNE